ncbi:flagellar hook protein FlgE [Betaproteobacteria bacterium GR16-43]|nr:flagellar hook protein FlgE [Betaproteobacteria bacterium GR16-43]
MGFQQGLSGLNAASRNLDVIGNNIANASTVGFKGGETLFADVYANQVAGTAGGSAGIGVSVASVRQNFGQGNITVTTNPLDMAINGNGFYRMSQNGTTVYSRNGQFNLDKDGYIVNAQNAKLTGYGVDAAGQVVTSTPVELQVSNADLTPNPSTQAALTLNLDSRQPVIAGAFDPTDATTYNHATSLTTFDSLGNAHTLTTYYVKTAANTWDVYGSADGAQLGAAALGTLTFQTNGAIDTTATTLPFTASIPLTNGAAAPLDVDLDFSDVTQFGSVFGVNQITQDGYSSGRLTGFNVSQDGTILGRYSNGQTRAQGQIVLANFSAPTGLQPLGGNLFAETSASGQPLVGAPETGNLGVLQSGAVEDSNVDLTGELVDMITAQRVYQANAQTIKAQDAILQTLVNLR